MPLLLGAPFLASFRALEPSRVLRLSPADFNTMLQATPVARDRLVQSLLSRVGGMEEATSAARRVPLVVGDRLDSACHDLRDFLARNFVEFEWLDPGNEDERARIPASALADDRYPALVLPDDTMLVRPSLRVAAEAVGLRTVPSAEQYDVVIIGGGPSGLSAAVYGASEGLHTLMIEGTAPGGRRAPRRASRTTWASRSGSRATSLAPVRSARPSASGRRSWLPARSARSSLARGSTRSAWRTA